MNRTVKIERLYALGNFKNLRLSEEVIDLPEEVTFNEKILNKIRYLLLLDIESTFRKYAELDDKLGRLSLEKALEFLQEEKTVTFNALFEKMISQKEKES